MSFLDDLANFGKGLIQAPVKFINTGAAQQKEILATGEGLLGQLTGSQAILRDGLRRQKQARQEHNVGHGLFGMGSFYNSDDALKGDPLTGAKKIGGGTLETAASVLPFAKGGSVALGLSKGALKTAAPKLLGQGAIYGGMYSAGNQLRENGGIDPTQLATDTAIGSVANLALPAALRGGRNVLQKGAQTDAAQAIKQQVLGSKPANFMFGDKGPVMAAQAQRTIATPKAPLVAQSGEKMVDPLLVKPKAQLNPKTELADGQKLSRFANVTAQNSDEISPELAKMVKENQSIYNPVTNEGRLAAAQKTFTGKSNDDAYLHVAKSFDNKNTSSQDVVNAIHVIKQLDNSGTEADMMKATELFDSVSSHLSKRGQEIQAASLLYNRTPGGLVYKAARDLKKAGVDMTPEMQAGIKALSENVANATNAIEKQRAIALLQKHVANLFPQNALDNSVSIWKAGLLSGAKTQTGNALSNGTFGAFKTASNPVAAGIDKLLSFKTGQRTKTATLSGILSGTKQGTKSGLNTLKTGIDPRSLDKYEQFADINMKNPLLQKVVANPANFVFRAMSAGDQPFYYASLKNNLYDIAKADGINSGLKGAALREHMSQTVVNPSVKQLEMATAAANKSVLGYDTIASKAVQGIHKGIDNASFANDSSKSIAHAAVSGLAPFVRVPTAFLARTLDYSPVGGGRAILKAVVQAKKGNFDQRALSEALGEATTGTGIIYLGSELTNSGVVSGQYPDDPKEQQRWKAEGIQANSVKIGGKWVSLNYLGPAGLLIGAGKDYHDAAVRGDNAAMQSIAGFGKNLMGQSFLTGFSGFADAINDPNRSLNTFINKQAGSVVPSAVNDLANLGDSKQRQANNVPEALGVRIPGVRNTLPVKKDVYGNELDQPSNRINQWLNPLRVSNSISDKNTAVSEVGRLHNVDENNKDLQVTPTRVDKNFSVDGQSIKLDDTQRDELQTAVGQATQSNWQKLIATPAYQKLSDTDKANALNKLRQDSATLSQRSYVTENGLATYKKGLTNSQKNLANGSTGIASFAKDGSGDGGSTVEISKSLSPSSKKVLEDYSAMSSDERDKEFSTKNDAEFNYKLAKYENDVSNGTLSKAQTITAKSALVKDKIGSQFPKEVRELYGISKAQLKAFAEESPENAALAGKVVEYGQALVDNGLYKYNKFGGGSGKGKKSTSSLVKGDSNASSIATTAAASKAAKSAKVSGRSASFQNKIAKQGIQAYKKAAKTTVSQRRTA